MTTLPERRAAYVAAAVARIVDELAAAAEGERNATLFRAAAQLAGLPDGPSDREISALLAPAASQVGLAAKEALRTIRSGCRHGRRAPKAWPVGLGSEAAPRPRVTRKGRRAPAPAPLPPLPAAPGAIPAAIRGTSWPSRSEPAGRSQTMGWPELVAAVARPAPELAGRPKERLPLWNLAEFQENLRSADTLVAAHGLLLDVDNAGPGTTAETLQTAWNRWAFVAHTTPSHAPGRPRWRIVLPLSRPATPGEAVKLLAIAREMAEPAIRRADPRKPVCDKLPPSQGYYVPAPGPHYEHLVNEGPPLNVDAELAAAEQEEAEGEPKAALRFALTDLGNGERLVARYRGRLLWCVARGWLAWDGRRWAPDRTGQVDKLAQETVRAIPEEAQGLEGEAWAALMKHAGRSEAAPRIKAMIELARPRLAILPELLDADPMVLNVANGTLDLRTGSLRPHDPADLLTKLAPVDFDPAATCPIWESFLRRVLAGDEDLIRFTQRALGYSLVGDTIEHALFLLYGTGCNGKSVFISTVCAIMGDYALTASFDSFLARRPGDSGPRDDLARLAGARMVAASEPPAGATWDEATLKALTGQDRIAARHLYHDSFEFTPAFKLWLSTNHKPRTRDSSLAFWRRIRLIPFVVTIPEQERDPRLADKLKAEAPGILAWMVRGCLDWQRRGLGQAEAVVKATGGYQTDEDAAQRFMDERCDVDPEAWTAARELWTAWQAWSAAAGEEPRSQKWLANRLVEKGLTSERVTRERQRGWRGVALLAADGSAPRTDRGRLFPETSPTSLMGGFSGGMCPQPSAPPYPSAPAPPPHDGQTIGAPAPLAALSGKHCLDGEAELVARDPSAPGGNGHGNLPEPPEWVVHLHDPIPPEEAEEWLAP